MRPAGMEKFDHINSAEVVWRHFATKPYGDGRPGIRWSMPNFLSTLCGCFMELGLLCPLGHPTKIVSAGAYTPKEGRHGEGRAIDIDALWWTVRAGVMESPRILLTKSYKACPAFYLGVEAHFRRFFGTVLGWTYNDDHKGHWHIDDGKPTGYRKTQMYQNFVSAARLHIWNNAPIEDILQHLQIPGTLINKSSWQRFLLATAIQGMNNGVDSLKRSL